MAKKTIGVDPSGYLRTSSFDVEGNLNFRRLVERQNYRDWLVGDGLRDILGHEASTTYPVGGDEPGNPGVLAVTSSLVFNSSSRPPSWTQTDAGLRHAFVISTLSSSQHEVSALNAFESGTIGLEQSPVPASGTEFYEKIETITRIYALTASVDLSGTSGGKVGEFVAASGNMFTGSWDAPCKFTVNVPDFGRLTNIRVWVEVINNQDPPSSRTTQIEELAIAIQSPNITGFIGIPWLNDKILGARPRLVTQGSRGGAFWGDSYILFEGDEQTAIALNKIWARDYNIRTIFDDSSMQRNNRHLDPLFRSGSDDFQSYILRDGSPNHFFTASLLGWSEGGSETGGRVSWISDERVVNTDGEFLSASTQSPPEGWLTGPGGVAADNEFATTGSNYGPNVMRPVYSLLDPVTQIAIIKGQPLATSGSLVGTRPGLRGTEVFGDWDCIIKTGQFEDTIRYSFFRQFRLELTFERNRRIPYRRRLTTFEKKTNVPSRAGHLVHQAFTSSSLGFQYDEFFIMTTLGIFDPDSGVEVEGIQEEFYITPDQAFRTAGITDQTGSLASDFAVFSRITGALSDQLTGSDTRHWYLDNEFGTPFIPLSSGSGEDPTFDIFTDAAENKKNLAETLSPSPLVTNATTLRSLLSKFAVTKKTRDIIFEKTSGSI